MSFKIDEVFRNFYVCRNGQTARRPSSATLKNAHLMAGMPYPPRGTVKSNNHGASSRKMGIHTKEYRSAPSLTATQGYLNRQGVWVDSPITGVGKGGVSVTRPVGKKGDLRALRPKFDELQRQRLSDLGRIRLAIGRKLSQVGDHSIWSDGIPLQLSGRIGTPLWEVTRRGARFQISVQLWSNDTVIHSDTFFVGA